MEKNRNVAATRKLISALNSALQSNNSINKTKKYIFNIIIECAFYYVVQKLWTINNANAKKIMATEIKFYRSWTRISRLERKENIEV